MEVSRKHKSICKSGCEHEVSATETSPVIESDRPLITLFNSQDLASSNPLFMFIQRARGHHHTRVREAEDCLASAYNRHAHLQVLQFTAFADRLRQADIFMLARVELMHWLVLIVPEQ
ncbi:unnamed protein product [Protopolystoma xenopodis]|uniref:Uncharacterized protein n=1 Tax=Protopolystoma xenopodis TaxID=117903 RepID=A0A3S5ANU4_9PLAT|nr:unnamed protein product [Protopolystoma xenopodis]